MKFLKQKTENILDKYIFIILTACGLQTACEDFVNIDSPRNEVTAETVLSNDETAIAAISGIYSEMARSIDGLTGTGIELYTGRYADELINYSSRPDRVEFSSNDLTPGNAIIFGDFWEDAYTYIYNANVIINGMEGTTGLTLDTRNQVLGEALFIRAFCHFYLLNLFGEVPYIASTDLELNAIVDREQEIQVYNKIVGDLLKAKELMFDDFEFTNSDRVRPNRGAATALLARVYLYMSEWALAEKESTELIDQSDIYILENDLNNVFLPGSMEAIWQLKPNSLETIRTRYGSNFILVFAPGDFFGAVSLKEDIYNAFEPGDKRQTDWVGIFNSGSDVFYYPYKYKLDIFTPSGEEWNVVFRLGEQYLIRAEARARQGNVMGAQEDINAIRHRAGLGDTPANDRTALLLVVEQERRLELFVEWGHRWLDLKRTGRADAVLVVIPEKDWQPDDVLWPIPEQEILNNPNLLPQNQGYN